MPVGMCCYLVTKLCYFGNYGGMSLSNIACNKKGTPAIMIFKPLQVFVYCFRYCISVFGTPGNTKSYIFKVDTE